MSFSCEAFDVLSRYAVPMTPDVPPAMKLITLNWFAAGLLTVPSDGAKWGAVGSS